MQLERCPECGCFKRTDRPCRRCALLGPGLAGQPGAPQWVYATPPSAPARSFAPGLAYFDANISRIDPAWLDGLMESPSFARDDGLKILEAIRANAIAKLSGRAYDSTESLDDTIRACNVVTLRHSGQVMVMASKVARLINASPQTARVAAIAAGFHDGDKDNTNFTRHHLDSAEFATWALHEAGLSDDEKETMAVRQAIMEHMPFGNGADPDNFMNRALVSEAATLVMTSPGDYKPRLRNLMSEALQKTPAAIAKVEGWLDAHAREYPMKDDLVKAMSKEFGGRELSYPQPSSDAAQILATAAISSGEHLVAVTGAENMLDMSHAYKPADITWAADGLVLASADSLPKIVAIRKMNLKSEPTVVAMASLAGGAFGQPGTAVDVLNALPIPEARASARREIDLMRGFMRFWQQQTFDHWASQQTEQVATPRRAEFAHDPFSSLALSAEEMLEYQPTQEEFEKVYKRYLLKNADKRGALCG